MRRTDLEQLYTRLEKPVYNVVYRWVWQAEEAQDIVQEAFVRLWRMRDRVELSTVEPLLFRIALNLAASHARWKRVRRWVSLDALGGTRSASPGADERLSERQDRERAREAVRSLPEELRRVVLLCEYSKLTYDEIGEILSIPPGTVGSRRHRALRLLRERLGGGADEHERPIRKPV
jgi:RNA polymerase sigma-70 factor (ECF subfamily)